MEGIREDVQGKEDFNDDNPTTVEIWKTENTKENNKVEKRQNDEGRHPQWVILGD